MVEAVGEWVTEVGERMVLEGEGLLRGSGEMMVLAGLCMGDERESMEDCGIGGTGEGWVLGELGDEAGEGVEEREECFIAERSG
jgi:hypothetical protein